MKRITASEARRNWFRLLDQVIDGEVVAIVRKGARIVIRREPDSEADRELPDYSAIIQVPDPDEADQWGWEWPAKEGADMELRRSEPR
jgi:antitoxin (DNA-binding transcriptional repressor) of toxin-antitoxin stability system